MVLFIPGFMQRGDAWRPVAELLPERYPSVLLDHREHSFEGRLGEIADAASPAGAEGAVLVGYSLGGRLALRAVLRDPDRYAGLVTVGATAGLDDFDTEELCGLLRRRSFLLSLDLSARRLRLHDVVRRYLLDEQRDALGGVCLNWGCIPSKALLKNAEILSYIHRSEEFGLHFDNFHADYSVAIDRSRKAVDRLHNLM
jgi:pimeloyl-ACP methyl ester carboxylesterase